MRSTNLRGYALIAVGLFIAWKSSAQYPLHIQSVDKDSLFIHKQLGLSNSFRNKDVCAEYIYTLPTLLSKKGYLTASVDSIGSDSAGTTIRLYVGEAYKWTRIDVRGVEPTLLSAVAWNEKSFSHRPLDFKQFQARQQQLLNYLEENGYPFAKVSLDSVTLEGNGEVSAKLKVEKGPLYHIDSIRLYGTGRISNEFMQRYLNIPNGCVYKKERLNAISKKILELPYIQEQQPWDLTMLGTGSVVNLYLKPRKSSQINALVGFLPSSDPLLGNKILVTGEATVNLRNALGNGETIGLNWQQLQVRSPRLDIAFQYPYLFKSPVGLDFAFDIFRKDSIFVNINLQVGGTFALADHQAGKLFLQRFQTIVNGINTSQILQTRRLDDQADLAATNLGIDYELNNTNYRLNPRTGNELRIITSAGTKKIRKNSAVLELKDPSDPSFDFESLYDTIKLKTYQFRAQVSGAHYLPLGRQSTLKMAFNGGFFQSGNIFRNELFQLGGYRLLRGFDEESQYLSQYAIGTVEYHLLYLMGQNSYFYVLADGGWGRNNSQNINVQYTYLGTGLGIAFETKAGVFNLAWAVGKRNDTEFNLRQSKLHFGFVNYF